MSDSLEPPQRARSPWPARLLGVLVLAAIVLAGFEVYAGHYQPLASAGYLKPLPSDAVHRVDNSGPDFAGPAGAHLQLLFGLTNTGPFAVHVSAVTALPNTTVRWAGGNDSAPQPDLAKFRALAATVPGRGGIQVLLDVVLPECSTGRPSSFDTVTVHWSALGRRHATPVRVIGDVPIQVCAGD